MPRKPVAPPSVKSPKKAPKSADKFSPAAKSPNDEPAKRLAAIQLDFETSILLGREIAAKHKITPGRLSQLAKEHGWVRGGKLERARAKADEKVAAAEARAAAVEEGSEAAVDATAQIMADVILGERRQVRDMRELATRMFNELVVSQDEAEKPKPKGRWAKKLEITPLSDRIDDLRKLGNTTEILVKLERSVFGITPDTPVDPSKRMQEAIEDGMAGLKAKFNAVLAGGKA